MKRCYVCAMMMLLCILALSGFTQAQGGSKGTIRGMFFVDTDKSGDYNDGDELIPISSATVKLYKNEGGNYVLSSTTVTDKGLGLYAFTSIDYGNYYVKFIIPTEKQADYEFIKVAPNGDLYDSNVSDIIDDEGCTDTFTVNSRNKSALEIDGGLTLKESGNGGGGTQGGTINGIVWNDLNGNGIQDGGENPITSGITVTLYESGTSNSLDSKTLDPTLGTYSFTYNSSYGGANDKYDVVFTLPGGKFFTVAGAGNDRTKDSDVDPTGKASNIRFSTEGTRIDAGIYSKASLGGTITNDLDNSIIQNPVVYLYECGKTTNPLTPTITNGQYSFTGLRPGSYYLKFVAPEGFILSSHTYDDGVNPGETVCFDIRSGDNLEANAKIHPIPPSPGTISGFAWIDSDGDGKQKQGQDPDPTPLQGAGVQLFNSSDVSQVTTSTGFDGKFSFTNIPAGTYYVQFVAPDGYEFTNKSGQVLNSNNSDADEQTGKTESFSVAPGDNIINIDAGLKLRPVGNGTISGTLFFDKFGEGILEPGEEVPGAKVELYFNNGTSPKAITTTDNQGTYSFTGLVKGNYIVKFYLPDNLSGNDYEFIVAAAKDANKPNYSDVNISGETGINGISDVHLNISGIDAGIQPKASLLGTVSGYVWNDNGNGRRENGEQFIPGHNVFLQVNNQTIRSTTTDNNGYYLFTSVPPGPGFKVKFDLKDGFKFSPANKGNNTIDSDVEFNDGTTAEFTLNANTSLAYDAGMYLQSQDGNPNPQINGILWEDKDGDGFQLGVSTEPGIGDWTVNLLDENKVFIQSTKTDNSTDPGQTGRYSFTHLTAGTYYIQFVNPGGYTFTLQNAVNDNRDSDVNSEGLSGPVVIVADAREEHVDAGVHSNTQPPSGNGKISGRLWDDTFDKDGLQGGLSNEPGIGAQTVELYISGGTLDGTLYKTTTTEPTGGEGVIGTFKFTDVVYGTYYVKFATLPSGYTFTLKDAGNDEKDSDADRTTGQTGNISVTTPAEITHIDAGAIQGETGTGSIGDFVWLDVNGNGEQNGPEPGVKDVTVELYRWDGTTFVSNGSTTTNNSGNYLFSNLIPGTYKVHFIAPTGFKFTQRNGNLNSATNSDADPASGADYGYTVEFQLNPSNPSMKYIDYVDAGLIPINGRSIGDFVWFDSNNNGVQDFGEPGVYGVTVLLYSTDNLTTPIAQDITNSFGKYLFSNLNPGTYRVQFILPHSFDAFTVMNAGSDINLDSDADPIHNGFTGTITLLTSADRLDIDAGLIRKPVEKADIGDFVWKDCDGDGIQDHNEPGIPNVMVELYKWDEDTPIMSAITDSKGFYLFKDLEPGDFFVKFVLPEGFAFVKKDQGANDALDSDADRTSGKTGRITLAGYDNLTIDAGLYGSECMPVSLGDFVWNDLNKNGIQNTGEPGLAKITVNLFKSGKTAVHKTTFTDKYGFYHFAGLLPGTYSVQFVLPKGYSFTLLNQGSNDALDSDADMASGLTAPYNLSSGEANNTIDAGMFEGQCMLANLGDFVWNDCNKNGVQDVGESGIGGVEVKLHACTSTHTNPSDPCTCGSVVASTKTDKNGNYMFANIMPGYYCVEIVVPCNFTITKPDQAEDFKDSDVIPSMKHTACIKVNPGETNLTVDAGLYPTPPATIGDLVWMDANKNGVQDNGEKGLCNVTVELYMCGVAKPVANTVTDNNGKYVFKNVISNTSYSLKFYLPKGYTFTSLDQGGNDNFDSDVCAKTCGGMTRFYDIMPDETNNSIDAGMYLATTSPCNYVWNDNNNNGLKDEGEAGISGITVELYQCSGNTLVQSVRTNETGLFTFTDILLDSYYMKILVPQGYKIGTASQEGDSRSISTNFGTDGQSTCFDVTEGITSIGTPVALVSSTTGVIRGGEIPTEFSLQQNYPNPFNPSTTIEFAVPTAGQYTVKVFNMLGQEVATLLDRELSVGYHMVVFDASKLTSGMYIYRLTGSNVVITKKMMLSK